MRCEGTILRIILKPTYERLYIIHTYALIKKDFEINQSLAVSSPYGIRTRITTVKGWCPSP